MENRPLVSIIMGIYNCEDTLAAAIDSLLAQTYTHWELIMCDDGSQDHTRAVAERYAAQFPSKMKLLVHENNKGLNQTLNDCLAEATGPFIARMDGDDLSLPKRLESELAAFEAEPELAVVSCPMIYFDENGEWGRGSNEGNEYPDPKMLARGTVHCHAPAMIRAKVLRAVGAYTVSQDLLRVEDWHLWIKIYAAGYRGKNISAPLYMMRDDQSALKRKNLKTCFREARLSVYATNRLGLSKFNYVYALRPIAVGLLPRKVYTFLHHLKLRNKG